MYFWGKRVQFLAVDEKELVEIAEKMTTQVTKQINAQMILSVQTVKKDTWQEVTTGNSK